MAAYLEQNLLLAIWLNQWQVPKSLVIAKILLHIPPPQIKNDIFKYVLTRLTFV